MNVPGFIARQFYVAGSLRNTPDGFELQAHNPMGDGVLVGVGRLRVDGREIPADAVTATRTGGEERYRVADVSRASPIHVRKGDRVTFHVAGPQLDPGEHRLEVELHELNLGVLRLSLSDRLGS
ncbi:MAG: hypothetical protein M3N29_04180 [Chloroflexota bacterium]|nr:hypothetical protein [Chloroflexota bacterium]